MLVFLRNKKSDSDKYFIEESGGWGFQKPEHLQKRLEQMKATITRQRDQIKDLCEEANHFQNREDELLQLNKSLQAQGKNMELQKKLNEGVQLLWYSSMCYWK